MRKSDIVRFASATAIAVATLAAAQPAFAEEGDIIVTSAAFGSSTNPTPANNPFGGGGRRRF